MFNSRPLSFYFPLSGPEKMTAAAGNKNSFTRLIAVVLTGILAGLSGMVLALILHAIQHLAFGYSPGQIVSAESFLQGVTDSSWPRRISAIVAGEPSPGSAGGCLDAMGRSGFQLRRRWLTLPCQCLRVPQRFMLCCRSSPWRWALRWSRSGSPGNGRAGGGDGGA